MAENKFNQLEIDMNTNNEEIFSIIESILFISGEPLSIKELSNIVDIKEDRLNSVLEKMKKNYEKKDRGIILQYINDSYFFETKRENSIFIQKLLKTNERQSLSRAALETLAIVVYNQPITRVEIDEIRGVKSDRALISLCDKGLLKKSGRKMVPGRPMLYSTTDMFLNYFGLEKLEQMPSLELFVEDIMKNNEKDIEEY
ncbi:SMC-Scp complex subunit ScpB [Clostridium sp. DL1XJH146]